MTTLEERIIAAAAKVASMKSQTARTRLGRSRTSVAKRATNHAEIAIKKILAPIDFSPASKKALKYAIRFARDYGSALTLLHVIEPVVSPTFEEVPPAPAVFKADMKDAEESLRTLVDSAGRAGVAEVRSAIRIGVATHEIVEAAEELDADLIVIATRGYKDWKHLVIGSIAARVVRAASCPVLVVREKEHDFV